MGKILNLIEGNMNGNAWEDLCVRCYRMKYQEQHYVAIPAVHKGDAGIEGYTKSGIVHQCYCPERSYSDNELYDHQRDKLSADIYILSSIFRKLAKFIRFYPFSSQSRVICRNFHAHAIVFDDFRRNFIKSRLISANFNRIRLKSNRTAAETAKFHAISCGDCAR